MQVDEADLNEERHMRYGSVANVSDRLSRLVLGSMVFSTEKQQLTNALLDRFVAAGGTAVDTARVYTGGSSEPAFGRWLQSRGCRQQMAATRRRTGEQPRRAGGRAHSGRVGVAEPREGTRVRRITGRLTRKQGRQRIMDCEFLRRD